MRPLELAKLNLIRRKASSLIAVSTIALSVALGGVIFRVFDLMNQRFSTLATSGTSLVGAKAGGLEILLGALGGEGEFPGFVPFALYETLKQRTELTFADGSTPSSEGLQTIVPMLYFGKAGEFRVLGTDDNFLSRPYSDDSVVVAQGQWFRDSQEIVAGAHVAEVLHLQVGQPVEVGSWSAQGVRKATQTFKISGILRANHKIWDRQLFASIEDGQKMIAENPEAMAGSIWGSKVLSYFWVFQDGNSSRAMENLINKRSVAQFVGIHEQRAKLREITGSGEDIGWGIMGFIVLLGALSVSAIMITRFDSMHLQIAVLRAIGYQQTEISRWLVLEGLMLGTVSVVLGALLDFLLFPVVRESLGKSLPPESIISSSAGAAAPVWIAALVSTVLATALPLYRLYRQDVHSSLKTV